MSEQGIAHNKLTDPNLHELKGASVAEANTVPFANGEGSTVWQPISFDKLLFDKEYITGVTPTEIDIPEPLSIQSMSATVDGSLEDGSTFVQTNKNLKELAVAHNELLNEFSMLLASHEALLAKCNTLITALTTLGFLTNEQ